MEFWVVVARVFATSHKGWDVTTGAYFVAVIAFSTRVSALFAVAILLGTGFS